MTAHILQALAQGYSITQVINWLKNNSKPLGKYINEALKQGYTEDEIGAYLTKGRSRSWSERQSMLGGSEREKAERIANYQPPIETAVRKALPKAALAAGAAAATPAALGLLARSLPATAQAMLGFPGAGNGPQGNVPAPTPPPTGQGPTAAAIPAVGAIAQAIQPGQGASIIAQMGNRVASVIQSLAGKEAPQAIAAVLEQHILSPGQKKWLAEQGITDLPGLIEDFIGNKESQVIAASPRAQDVLSAGSNLSPPSTINVEEPPIAASPLVSPHANQTTQNEILKTEKQEIQPQSRVLLPSGDVGQVKDIKNGIAKLDVNGKERNVKADELIQSPLPEKDLADLYQDLVNRIPESDRSAMINVAGYDPEHNELVFFPHGPGSALYVYKDIPKEFADKLQKAMFQAKTTGQNFYGAWSQGEESRGAGMAALIKELQKAYGGKGKEYIRKYQNVYDYLGPAKQAVKAKEQRQREEKRAAQGKAPRKRKKPGNG